MRARLMVVCAAAACLALIGCAPSPTEPTDTRSLDALESRVYSLEEQVAGLQVMLTSGPARLVQGEPAVPVDGRYMALLRDVSPEELVVDFVSPDTSDEFSLYRNDSEAVLELPFADHGVIAVMAQEWAGPYMLAPNVVSPVIVDRESFVSHWRGDTPEGPLRSQAYFVTIEFGSVSVLEQIYYP